MASSRRSGTTALEQYRERLREAPTCSKCGHTDEGGEWQTAYREQRLVYRHVCPRCDAIERRVLRINDED